MLKGLGIPRNRARRWTAIGVCAALTTALLAPAVAQAAPVTACTATFSGTSLTGPVEVPAGATCTLVNVSVSGNGSVTVDGALVADNSTFGGSLIVHPGGSVQQNGGTVAAGFLVRGPNSTVNLNGGSIRGALDVTGPGVTGSLTCPVNVGGSGTLKSAAVAVTGAGCAFGGALQVTKVPLGTPFSLTQASVGGTMIVSDNATQIDLGPLHVNGALLCQNNVVPPASTGDISVGGATVGQCSGIRSKAPQPAGVSGPLSRALLSLSPSAAGPKVVGGTQRLTATLSSPTGPVAGQVIHFAVSGSNPLEGTATTDSQGVATFLDTGARPGTDHVVASAVSPGGTIYSNGSQVVWVSLADAKLTLVPAKVPNDVVGTTQVLTATLTAVGQPIVGQAVAFTVTGANPAAGMSTTGPTGSATFSYVGGHPGTDTALAKASGGGSAVTSTASVLTWILPVGANATDPEGVSTSAVQGYFFAESAAAKSFVAKPGDAPAFGQTFPNVEFNPPVGTIPGEPASGPAPGTRPFTDVTTDAAGGFSGTIAAAGAGFAAGRTTAAGDLTTFDASFTGSLNVAKAQDLTLQVTADDGFLLGVGGAATPVNPAIAGTPATTTPFQGYPLDGAFDQPGTGGPATYQVTVHLPAAGVYPYELDYLSCCDRPLSLTLGVVTTVSPAAQPYNLFAGYADNTSPGAGASFPNPWQGAPNTTFVGSPTPFDTGGLRFDNTTTKPLTVSAVSVDVGAHHYTPTAGPQTVPPGGRLVVAGTNGNFDTSEAVVSTANAVADRPKATKVVSSTAPAGTGFTATPFATGFPNVPSGQTGIDNTGPTSLAFDTAGRLYVGDAANLGLYLFGRSGGDAAANKLTGMPAIGGIPLGLTFSKSGRLYIALNDQLINNGEVDELNPATGAVVRQVTTFGFIEGPLGMVTDPLSGDLMLAFQFDGVKRISHYEDAGPVQVTPYGPGGIDGLTVAPDGTLFGVQQRLHVLEIAGTDKPQPAAVTHLADVPLGDGIALINPPAGQPITKLVVNRNDGIITQVDYSNPAAPILTDIITGGTRGDFVATGPDGCLYATQTDSVERVTATGGSCPFVPPPPVCTPSAAVPMVHVTVNGTAVTYPDPSLTLTAGGKDGEACATNESRPWAQLAGTATTVVVPIPPAVSLLLSPAVSRDDLVNSSQTLRVAATDQAGHPAVNVAVTLAVAGANPETLTGTTDNAGGVSFMHRGANAGTDTASASAVVAGAAAFSNDATIVWTIPVPPPPPPLPAGQSPPTVTITAPTNGQTITVLTAVTAVINPPAVSPIATWTVSAQPVVGGATVAIASGTGTPPAQLATLDPTKLAVGTYGLTVGATTKAGASASAVVAVIVGTGGSGPGGGGGTPAQASPSITKITPTDGILLTMPTPVTAVITPPTGETIASWGVGYHSASSPLLLSLGSGSGPPPASLGAFDPTLLPDDTYALQITATASGGGVATATVSVAVTGGLKPGRYVTTFKDLSIPVAGFSADVTRVYDSFDKSVGDFGVGWHLGASDYKVSVNAPLGAGGWAAQPNSCSLFGCTYGFVSSAPHYASVTFPDGHQEVFDFTPTGGFGPLFFLGTSGFTPRAGSQTTSTLAVDPASDPGPAFGFDGNLYAGLGTAFYAPSRFVLTMPNGTKLLLDQSTGLVSETDPHGNTVGFDSTGIHATNASGTAEPGIAYSRDASGRVTQVTGPSGQKLAYTYSAAGDLISVTDPVGNVTTFSYDANHDLLKTTGPGGPLNTYTYDASGRLTSITDGNGNVTKVDNNVAGAQQVITDPLGVLTNILSFDTQGDVTSDRQIAGAVSRTTSTTYDVLGDVTSTVDPLGNTTFATFDGQRNETSATDALGEVSTAIFGPFRELLSRTNARGLTAIVSYDSRANPVAVSQPSGARTVLTYDVDGNPTGMTDPLVHAYAMTFNATGGLTAVTDPLGNTLSYRYDLSGNPTSFSDPVNQVTGKLTAITYDAANRPVSRTDPLGNQSRTGYDVLGNLASTTTANGNQTTTTYDNAGRPTQITDPMGGATQLQYDRDGQLVSTTDADGHRTSYGFDGFGDRTSVTNPLGQASTFTYDAGRRLEATTDARGQAITNTYDAVGRLTQQSSSTHSDGRTYDAAGELTTVIDPTGTTTYTYDIDGRVTQVASPEGTLGYAYDAAGRRTQMSLPGSKTIAYTHDKDGNITAIGGLGQALSVSYNADSQILTNGLTNGVTTTYGYDLASRVTSVSSGTAHTTLTSFAYTLDPDANPLSVTSPSGTTTYAYDKLDRLASATGPGAASFRYSYDALGKITQATRGASVTAYSYDAAGRLRSFGGQTVGTDADGNITSQGGSTFTYDAFGRLTNANTGGTAATASYNGTGLRVATTGPATTDLWDQVDPSNGTLSSTPQLVSDGSNTYISSNNQVVVQVNGATSTSYLPDALGSIRATAGADGTLTGTTTYSPFGQQIGQTGPPSPFGFAGELQDSTGLVFLRARYLAPTIGQFLTPDALQPSAPGTQGYDQYAYALNDPIAKVDPTGHQALSEGAGNASISALRTKFILLEEGAVAEETAIAIIETASTAELIGACAPYIASPYLRISKESTEELLQECVISLAGSVVSAVAGASIKDIQLTGEFAKLLKADVAEAVGMITETLIKRLADAPPPASNA